MEPEQNKPAAGPPTMASGSRRGSGRLEQELLYCQYGQIVNLSSGGCRVACKKMPPKECEVMLFGVGEAVKVKARLAWKKKVGLFKHHIGFEFLDVSPELKSQLTRMATSCRMRRAL
jgi:hypothetical protein